MQSLLLHNSVFLTASDRWRSSGVYILFDLTDVASFAEAKAVLVSALEQQRQPPLFVILIGTKLDRPLERKVAAEEAKSLARYHEVSYVELCTHDSVLALVELTLKLARQKRTAQQVRKTVCV